MRGDFLQENFYFLQVSGCFPSHGCTHLPGTWNRSRMGLALCIAICVLVGLGAAQDATSGARLLASKHILNQHLVQKKDLTIQYGLHNVGDATAYDVHLDETNFDKADFDFVTGFTQAHWDRIAPGANVTHTLILQPKEYRIFNFTAARVQYRTGESRDAQTAVGWTSSPGEGQIWEINQFNRLFAPHYADWITFLIMCVPTVGIPYFLWYTSKQRFEIARTITKKQ